MLQDKATILRILVLLSASTIRILVIPNVTVASYKATYNVMVLLIWHNPLITLPQILGNEKEHVWHLFVIRTAERDRLQQYLLKNNVQTLIHYPIPPHKQKAYKKYNEMSFPLTEKIHEEVLSLPMSAVLEEGEVEFVVKLMNGLRNPET